MEIAGDGVLHCEQYLHFKMTFIQDLKKNVYRYCFLTVVIISKQCFTIVNIWIKIMLKIKWVLFDNSFIIICFLQALWCSFILPKSEIPVNSIPTTDIQGMFISLFYKLKFLLNIRLTLLPVVSRKLKNCMQMSGKLCFMHDF